MRIWMDPVKLNAFGLTVQDIQEALIKENIEMPAGKYLEIRVSYPLEHLEDYKQKKILIN